MRKVAFSSEKSVFSVCFACRQTGGEIVVSDESWQVAFYSPEQIAELNVHDSIRLRIQHYLGRSDAPFIG